MDPRLQIYFLIAALGALIGALVTPLAYWGKGRKPSSGFFVGVALGLVGNLLLLIPLWLFLKPRRLTNMEVFNMTVAYNMGTAAVLGGRLEEARYYFSQVTQADPQHVGAWLYLANLATSPLEAWNFIQQARAIDPGDPVVLEAVAIVWPQVQHLYGERERGEGGPERL
jgi:drug/metabolite transporter (DMT)-like permease